MVPTRRFPPPWSVEETPNCFIARDANGQALSYIYYESEPGGVRQQSCSARTRRGGLRSASYYGSAAVTAKSQSQPISPIWIESDLQNRGLINLAKQTAPRRPGTTNKCTGYACVRRIASQLYGPRHGGRFLQLSRCCDLTRSKIQCYAEPSSH
jgi:hypothetical protein